VEGVFFCPVAKTDPNLTVSTALTRPKIRERTLDLNRDEWYTVFTVDGRTETTCAGAFSVEGIAVRGTMSVPETGSRVVKVAERMGSIP
jgi:hypothetical protein